MGLRRTYDHEAVLTLRARGFAPRQVAAHLGIDEAAVKSVTRAARDRGDARATAPVRRDAVLDVAGDLDRPGVMVVSVVVADRKNDGGIMRVKVSLPRVSILDGWSGRAATEPGGGVA